MHITPRKYLDNGVGTEFDAGLFRTLPIENNWGRQRRNSDVSLLLSVGGWNVDRYSALHRARPRGGGAGAVYVGAGVDVDNVKTQQEPRC